MFRRSFRGDQGTKSASSVMLAFLQADDARYFGQQKSKRNREKRIEKKMGGGGERIRNENWLMKIVGIYL